MKKIIIFTVFLVSFTLSAQNPPTAQTYQTQQNQYWQTALQLIQSQITTGILYSKVTPFSNLYNFNRVEHNTANARLFAQALSELYRASNQTQFVSVSQLKNINKQHYLARANSSIPLVEIGVLNTGFNFLYYDDENESNGGLKLINNVYTPIANKPSVFTKQVTLISPQQELITASSNGTVKYKITSSLFFNQGKQIKTVVANFDTTNNYTLVNNGVINSTEQTVQYTTFGKKELQFTVTYTDNSTLITYASITIENSQSLQPLPPPPTNCAKTNVVSYNSSIPYKAWDEQTVIYGKLAYKIFFGNNNQTGVCSIARVKKPIIIIDGFDPGDTRRIEDLDCLNDPYCKKLFSNEQGVFQNDDHESIYELMIFGNNPNDNIVKKLQEEGYDVIIINLPTIRENYAPYEIIHDYGADYIQRNAMSLVSFIKDVNINLTNNNSTEKLVVVGPSMGGQITRYALAYMEKKEHDTGNTSWNHNTWLWVSVDSPHQGANIPLAVQGSTYFLGFISDSENAKKKYKEKLRSPAAKQMLIDHYDYFTSSTKSPYFLNYQADLKSNGLANSNGYPTKSRNIAMVNGSIAGKKTAQAGQRFLDMRGYIDLSFWFIVQHHWSINLFTIKNNYQQNYNQSGMVFDVRANQASLNFYNSLWTSRSNPNWQGSLDVASGGLYNSGNDLKEEAISTLKEGVFDWSGPIRRKMYVPSTEEGIVVPHSFIPTHSALDTNGFTDWYQPINKNLVCSNQTPFNTYYGETENTQHVSFTQQSKEWLFKELGRNEQEPPIGVPSNTTIVGSNLVCYDNTVYFSTSLGNTCVDGIIWDTSNNLVIVNNNGANIEVRAMSNYYTGTGWIKATLPNGIVLTKTVKTGKPEASRITFNRFAHYTFQNQTWNLLGALYNGDLMIDNYTWQWQVPNSMIQQTSPQHSYINFRPNVSSNTQITIRTRASNECGCSAWKSQVFDVIQSNSTPCGGAGQLPCKNDIIEY